MNTCIYLRFSLGYDVGIPVEVYRRFGEKWCLHRQGRRVSQARNKKKQQIEWSRINMIYTDQMFLTHDAPHFTY
jgi:hypothetical protein